MLTKETHQVTRGMLMWRGWELPGIVAKIGVPVEDEDMVLVPVQYVGASYAIIRARALYKIGKTVIPYYTELRPANPRCMTRIRESGSMPQIVAIQSGCYQIGVTEDDLEQVVYVRRHKHSIVSEQVIEIH